MLTWEQQFRRAQKVKERIEYTAWIHAWIGYGMYGICKKYVVKTCTYLRCCSLISMEAQRSAEYQYGYRSETWSKLGNYLQEKCCKFSIHIAQSICPKTKFIITNSRMDEMVHAVMLWEKGEVNDEREKKPLTQKSKFQHSFLSGSIFSFSLSLSLTHIFSSFAPLNHQFTTISGQVMFTLSRIWRFHPNLSFRNVNVEHSIGCESEREHIDYCAILCRYRLEEGCVFNTSSSFSQYGEPWRTLNQKWAWSTSVNEA